MGDIPIYTLKNIRQGYKNRFLLDVPELSIEKGSSTGFVGPNGSGKSTLFRMFAFLEEPREGSIFYEGGSAGQNDNARSEVTMLQQDPYLLKRTVFENIAYGIKMRGLNRVKSRVHEALEQVGLAPGEFGRRSWRSLSGGEAQRVSLAARLVLEPKVLILDEPTSNIDRDSAHLIKKAVIKIRERHNATLIISSHDHLWLNQVADKIYRMQDGRIIGSGNENIIEGLWHPDTDDLWSKILPDGQRIFATEPPAADSVALLNPSDIIISSGKPASMSAQNSLKGMITSMSRSREFGKIKLDVDVHGLTLTCNLTQHAVNDLKLLPGMEVWLIFKASSLEWN
ncbi:MAG: ATP-binding cassette domain-containing protein [Spirochaetes bacterium]|jgi:tungstate transport system ATP-binding protein|nr:ATP-binding cassette domain-containing protein [Spirochaetota bacterium]